MKKAAARPRADFDSAVRMGFLIHELRNALACVFVAHSMLKRAGGGRAAALLERNLRSMRDMLDRATEELRLHKEPPARHSPVHLSEAVGTVLGTASEEARAKGLTLFVKVEPRLAVFADGPYLESALSNLVQNAIKFTKPGGTVAVRAFEKDGAAVLEIEDQCGGLPAGGIQELFEPFSQKGEDRSGLGLGLAICRRAVALNRGALSARDLPGKGCVFTISLPAARVTTTS